MASSFAGNISLILEYYWKDTRHSVCDVALYSYDGGISVGESRGFVYRDCMQRDAF